MARLYESQCYCTNLRRSAGAVSAFYDGALKDSGLNASQYYLLVNLSRLGSANITRWAEQVGLERSTMVRNVRVLESHGWVQKQGRNLTLAPEGQAVLEAAIPRWEAAQRNMEIFLGREDAEAVLRIGLKLQGLEANAK